VPRRKPAPPPNWSLRDWAPLSEAFIRIPFSDQWASLSARELYQDLLNGRLKSALRQISRDGQETFRLLTPSDWRQWRVQFRSRLRGPKINEVVIQVTSIDENEAVDGYFFVRRADLDKHYPATPLAPATASDRRTDDRRRKPGPKIKHNWKLRVAGEAARIYEKEGRNPTARELAEFCVKQWNYHPDESEIHKLLRVLLNG
jgi:hypothetical protein